MLPLLQSEILIRLGWALLNSFWQLGLLWLVYLLLTETNKRFTAAARHNLALLLSGAGLLWFVFNLTMAGPERESLFARISLSIRPGVISAVLSPVVSLLTVVYLLRLLLWMGWYIQGFQHLRQSGRRPDAVHAGPLQWRADSMSSAMGLNRPVRVLLVDWIDTAQTIGFLKPLVLLPVALINRLSPEQAESILLHELLHIRRNDYLVNIGMTVFRTIFFFNPFARLFFKSMAREREHACDDGVLQWNYPSGVYAEALFTLEKFRQNPHAFSLAAHGHNPRLLIDRIRRLLGEPGPRKRYFSPFVALSLAAALGLFILNMVALSLKSPVLLPASGEMTAPTKTASVALLIQASETEVADPPVLDKKLQPAQPEKRRDVHLPKIAVAPSGASSVSDETIDEVIPETQLHYTERAEQRNYSNEKASPPEMPLVVDIRGMPYVPQASFSYSPLGDSLQPADVLLENKLKAMLVIGKIKTAEIQNKLHRQVARNIADLRQLKKQSLQLLEKKQKSLQPELDRIEKNIQLKKQEIRRLNTEIQVRDGEIIVI